MLRVSGIDIQFCYHFWYFLLWFFFFNLLIQCITQIDFSSFHGLLFLKIFNGRKIALQCFCWMTTQTSHNYSLLAHEPPSAQIDFLMLKLPCILGWNLHGHTFFLMCQKSLSLKLYHKDTLVNHMPLKEHADYYNFRSD